MSARLSDAFEALKSLIPPETDPAALQAWKENGAEILSAQGGEQPRQDDSDQASLAGRLRALKGWDARAEAELVAAAVTAMLGRTRRDD